jgi:hypothetical protein
MMHQKPSKAPDVSKYIGAVRWYHRIMLDSIPKVQLEFRIHEQLLLVHIPEILSSARSLLCGSSWFLEALNMVCKHQLTQHTNCGGEKEREDTPGISKQSEEAIVCQRARAALKCNKQTLPSVWAFSDPKVSILCQKCCPEDLGGGCRRACSGRLPDQ